MKVHMSLPATSVEETREFYSTLLGSEPVKVKSDYLKFDPDDIALNISFHLARENQSIETNRHLGFQMKSEEEFNAVHRRIAQAGLVTKETEESVCCYANQNKFWTTDPTGFKWEIYLLKEDSNTKASQNSTCCVTEESGNEKACC